MSFVEVKISGLDQIQKRLEELRGPKARAAMRKSLADGSDIVLAEMQREAPRDTGFLDEHFNRKISTKDGGTSGTAFIGPQGKIKYPKRGVGAGRTISVASVARFAEFGTSKQAANPFMSRSFATSKESVLQKIISTLKSALGM